MVNRSHNRDPAAVHIDGGSGTQLQRYAMMEPEYADSTDDMEVRPLQPEGRPGEMTVYDGTRMDADGAAYMSNEEARQWADMDAHVYGPHDMDDDVFDPPPSNDAVDGSKGVGHTIGIGQGGPAHRGVMTRWSTPMPTCPGSKLEDDGGVRPRKGDSGNWIMRGPPWRQLLHRMGAFHTTPSSGSRSTRTRI